MKLTANEALVALRALYATEPYHNEQTAYAIKYVDLTHVVPDWLVAMTTHTNVWYVRHLGRNYETRAASREDAINNIRYNLYGFVPADALDPFDAINPAFIVLDAVGGNRRDHGRVSGGIGAGALAERLKRFNA